MRRSGDPGVGSQRAAQTRTRACAPEAALLHEGRACFQLHVLLLSGKRSGRDRPRQCPVARTGRAPPPRTFGRNPAECAGPPRRENQISGRGAAAWRAKPLAASETAGRGCHRRPDGRCEGQSSKGIWLRSWAALFSRAGPSGGLAWPPAAPARPRRWGERTLRWLFEASNPLEPIRCAQK